MLADATRIRILWALLDGEQPVNNLAVGLGKPPNTVSQHLAKLRMAHLVQTRREGSRIFYRIENDHVRQLVRDAISHVDHATSAAQTPALRVVTGQPSRHGRRG